MKKTAIMLFAAMGMMFASCSESTPAEEPKVDDATGIIPRKATWTTILDFLNIARQISKSSME